MTGVQGAVYLLHFQEKYKHAQHYLGWARYLDVRIQHHRDGTGARLMQVIRLEGIDWTVAATWQGTRADERRLKNRHDAPRFCPVCSPGNRRLADMVPAESAA